MRFIESFLVGSFLDRYRSVNDIARKSIVTSAAWLKTSMPMFP
jgi:hypothetical protein